MTCKDCYHFKVCDIRIKRDYEIKVRIGLPNAHCPYFKDKSRIVELPCMVGDTVYVLMGCRERFFTTAKVYGYIYNDVFGFCVLVDSDKFNLPSFPFSEFGRTIFETKEAAEQALRERENK